MAKKKKEKTEVELILEKPELTRMDASILISNLFSSPEDAASSILINPKWLREQINATKPFLKATAESLRKEALNRLSKAN